MANKDVQAVFDAIGPNRVFFRHILKKQDAELAPHVVGMNPDQLKAADRLRAVEEDHKEYEEDFDSLCRAVE